jgi:hypothetical protein
MRPYIILLAASLLLSPARAADKNELPKDVRAVLEKASELELLSLDPVTPEKPKAGFHGWKVLGQTTVKKDETRKELLEALIKGVAENQKGPAKCFQPRLGIRAKHESKQVDLVICFECLQIELYADDKPVEKPVYVSRSPEPAFDKVLKDAGVKLADKPAK